MTESVIKSGGFWRWSVLSAAALCVATLAGAAKAPGLAGIQLGAQASKTKWSGTIGPFKCQFEATLKSGLVQRIVARCPSLERDYDPHGDKAEGERQSLIKHLDTAFSATAQEEERKTVWKGLGFAAELTSQQDDAYDPPVFFVKLMIPDSDQWKPFWERFGGAIVAGDYDFVCRHTQFPFKDGYWDAYDKAKSASSKDFAECKQRIPRLFTDSAREIIKREQPAAVGKRYELRLDISRIAFVQSGGTWKLLEHAYEE